MWKESLEVVVVVGPLGKSICGAVTKVIPARFPTQHDDLIFEFGIVMPSIIQLPVRRQRPPLLFGFQVSLRTIFACPSAFAPLAGPSHSSQAKE